MAAIRGGCLCGAVRYEGGSEPTAALSCHCRDCQYVSGGEPADVIVVTASSVDVTQGEPKVFWSKADSGNRVYRSFCDTCGTPLFAGNVSYPEMIAIKIGSLDESGRYPPTAHTWTVSAQPWHHIELEQTTFERNPG
jgi:hypothetical protein